jgi:hypothetical protein
MLTREAAFVAFQLLLLIWNAPKTRFVMLLRLRVQQSFDREGSRP